ncbi:MAG: hypothetical protein GXO45_03840 [Aquificae bacterium]|nr:hypothetical protein [Aquificota bacterium]
MEKFREDEFSVIQRNIERKFLQNLQKLETVKSKEEFLEEFPKLWKKKKRFEEHIRKRKNLGHIPEEDAEFTYAKHIIQVLSAFDRVFIEKKKLGSQVDYFYKDNWVVIINDKGKIETAYKLETTLSKFVERHKIKNELREGEINEEFRKIIKGLWNRVKLF